MLVSVKIFGGDVDLAGRLQGLTMCAHMLEGLVAIPRTSRYAAYERDGTASRVAEGVSELHRSKYGEAEFTPDAILSAVDVSAVDVPKKETRGSHSCQRRRLFLLK
eukprot:6010929-Karenia_brevis.AAC.1